MFIVRGIVTPDGSAVSQVALPLPMLALYVLIGIASIFRPRDVVV